MSLPMPPLPGVELEEAKQGSRIFLGAVLGGIGSCPGEGLLLCGQRCDPDWRHLLDSSSV